jgi:hypothetical protein
MPPSPWLSARKIRIAYFRETITINVHRISDATPRIVSGESVPPAWAACLKA